MNNKTVLLYPVCTLSDMVAEPLSRFFSEAICFVPSENELSEQNDVGGIRLRQIPPAPLGRRLETFNRMVKEIKNWAIQMGAGENLRFENLVAMAEKQQSESVQDIMRDIKGRKEGRVLAIARLFLKLAMENDIRQEELERELHNMKDAEMVIADILGKEELSELSNSRLGGSLSVMSGKNMLPELSMIGQRIRSWTAIATKYEGKPLTAMPLGLTSDTKDKMDIAFETISDRKHLPFELLSLNLPDPISDLEKMSDSSFQSMWEELTDVAMKGPWKASALELIASKVQRAWERRLGKKKKGGISLHLTAYPGCTSMQLMKQAAGLSKRLKTGFLPDEMNISFFLA